MFLKPKQPVVLSASYLTGIGAKGPGLWRYRVGVYRVIVSIEDAALRILVIRIGHRSAVYR